MADPPPDRIGVASPLVLVPPHVRPRIDAPLPSYLTTVVGRQREVVEVIRLLRAPGVRLVTLSDPGGVGKTRLAVRVAECLQPAPADGIAFVSLARLIDPALVVTAIAAAVGLRAGGEGRLSERLSELIRDRELLLILDNVEQVAAAASDLLDLLSTCPRLTLLVTSRRTLHVSGEHVVGVSPLGVPSPRHGGDVVRVAACESVQLFLERARAVRNDVALTPSTAAAIAEIVRRLDGLPLAIELVAARMAHLTPVALLDHLEPRLPLLTGGPHDAPDRQRTMAATIGWSCDLLTEPERTLLRRLAPFVGGFRLNAAVEVATAVGLMEMAGLESVA